MQNKFVRNIPNILTSIRIIGAIVLLFIEPLSLTWYLIYFFCGITDGFDGFIARKLHCQSIFGSILDSVSDLLFLSVMAVSVMPTVLRLFDWSHWMVIIVVFSFHMLAYLVCAIKFRKFSSVHTYLNKAMSLLLFFFPFTLIGEIHLLYSLYIYIGGFIAFLSSIEINLIHIFAKEYNEKNKTLLFVLKDNKAKKMEEMN